MHWSEEIAQRIIERKPDKEEYGLAPPGSARPARSTSAIFVMWRRAILL